MNKRYSRSVAYYSRLPIILILICGYLMSMNPQRSAKSIDKITHDSSISCDHPASTAHIAQLDQIIRSCKEAIALPDKILHTWQHLGILSDTDASAQDVQPLPSSPSSILSRRKKIKVQLDITYLIQEVFLVIETIASIIKSQMCSCAMPIIDAQRKPLHYYRTTMKQDSVQPQNKCYFTQWQNNLKSFIFSYEQLQKDITRYIQTSSLQHEPATQQIESFLKTINTVQSISYNLLTTLRACKEHMIEESIISFLAQRERVIATLYHHLMIITFKMTLFFRAHKDVINLISAPE